MNGDWKYRLRESMEDYSAPVPEGLWDGISAAVAAGRRRRTIAWCVAVVSAAAAIVALAVFNRGAAAVDFAGADTDLLAEETVVTVPEIMAEETVVTAEEIPAAESPVIRKPAVGRVISDNTPTEDISFEDEPVVVPEKNADDKAPRDERKSVPENTGTISIDEYIASMQKTPARKKRGFSVGLLASGGTSSSRQTSGYGLTPAVALSAAESNIPLVISPDYVSILNGNRSTSDKTVYRMPVNYGLSVSFGIAPRLAVETGIFYSTLSSSESSGNENSYIGIEHRTGYAGLPLNLQYDIVNGSRLRLYASAGGSFRIPLYNMVRLERYIGKQLVEAERLMAGSAPSVWSLNAAAGLQFILTGPLSLYAEPGAAWYFPGASEIKNIYTERPFNFNLTVGLRFGFGY